MSENPTPESDGPDWEPADDQYTTEQPSQEHQDVLDDPEPEDDDE